MKTVIQRVRSASVRAEGQELGSIGRGLLVLVGIHGEDTHETVEWCCEKIRKMRIFKDEEDRMNLSVEDVGGALLLVPQFTLYGDATKGNRPSFMEAADPEMAEERYNYMLRFLNKSTDRPVASGSFGAYMEVELCNDGPVTIILER